MTQEEEIALLLDDLAAKHARDDIINLGIPGIEEGASSSKWNDMTGRAIKAIISIDNKTQRMIDDVNALTDLFERNRSIISSHISQLQSRITGGLVPIDEYQFTDTFNSDAFVDHESTVTINENAQAASLAIVSRQSLVLGAANKDRISVNIYPVGATDPDELYRGIGNRYGTDNIGDEPDIIEDSDALKARVFATDPLLTVDFEQIARNTTPATIDVATALQEITGIATEWMFLHWGVLRRAVSADSVDPLRALVVVTFETPAVIDSALIAQRSLLGSLAEVTRVTITTLDGTSHNVFIGSASAESLETYIPQQPVRSIEWEILQPLGYSKDATWTLFIPNDEGIPAGAFLLKDEAQEVLTQDIANEFEVVT
jgi:hypothetical protein